MAGLRRATRWGMVVAGLVAVALVAAACGGSGDAGGDGGGDAGGDPRARVDWAARSAAVEGVDGRYAVEFCDGEGPFLCVSLDGDHAGAVELLEFESPGDDLEAWARDFYATIAEDRAAGCGEGYRLDGDEPVQARVAGRDGLRYSFTGYLADGRASERAVAYAVVDGGSLFLIAASAYEPFGCPGTEGGEFTVQALRDFEPVLGAVAAGSALPEPSARDRRIGLGDGTHTGYLGAADAEGRLPFDPVELLSGPEAVERARADGVIGPEEDLPNDVYVRNTEELLVPLALGSDLAVALVDCTAGCELRPVSPEAYLSGSEVPFGGDAALFEVEVRGGVLVAISEVYLP